MTSKKINTNRKRIDAIDSRILDLIQKRATLAKEIGNLKKKNATNRKASFYRPARESSIIRNLIKNNSGPIVDKKIKLIFKELISACLSLEQQLNIAFLGPLGTHSEGAVKNHFGSSVKFNPRISIDDVFNQVKAESSDFGIVPVENSSEGVVNSTLNCLTDFDIKICGETYIDINHYLAGSTKSSLKATKKVASHAQALGQCTKWLEKNLPNIERVATSSTAEAAELAKSDSRILCIVSEHAIIRHKLKCHANNIQDFIDNKTRFIVVGNQEISRTGFDKTSLLIQTVNQPGALVKLLSAFKKEDINLHRIETRPSRQTTDSHNFFIDCEGHNKDKKLRKVIDEIRKKGAFVRILGSYPLET